MLTKTRTYARAEHRPGRRGRGESDGRESEHVIKTFTHEIEISLICFHFFHLSKLGEKNEIHPPNRLSRVSWRILPDMIFNI